MKDAAPTVSIVWLRACLCGSNSRTYHPRHRQCLLRNSTERTMQWAHLSRPNETESEHIENYTPYGRNVMYYDDWKWDCRCFESEAVFPNMSHVNTTRYLTYPQTYTPVTLLHASPHTHTHTHTHTFALSCTCLVTCDAFNILRSCKCACSLYGTFLKWLRL
jgi:hypothetical protein